MSRLYTCARFSDQSVGVGELEGYFVDQPFTSVLINYPMHDIKELAVRVQSTPLRWGTASLRFLAFCRLGH
jgi:hypothetical protein